MSRASGSNLRVKGTQRRVVERVGVEKAATSLKRNLV